ncbi:MAG: response regulator transcription factor [Bacteroidales bacterium]|jgi:DNA-binding NarL/FixJ family response regulator|nr:response regulator transcription factor [Bacteroidales bacterium]HOL97164.1 response regulator transcription factor [Bacteroidales bacterium]HRS99341.1 response regulator transcription factor [Bacteroidales bacterium]HRT79843.1 response regulator transcription factor [Bacteroidales bacterium]HUM31480.1 response regulator transcription factor [Bacteroidales bacterium]
MNDDKVYNIIIVDDHALFRNGLKLLLNKSTKFKVIAEASNGKEFINLLNIVPVDIVLLDIQMPEMNGIEAAQIALKNCPNLKIITLSMYGDEEYYYKMVNLGVCGFLMKDSDIDEVFKALNSVIEGKNYFSQELLQNIIKNIHGNNPDEIVLKNLTQREIEIIQLICQGYSNIEIGEKLFLSKRTVEKHRANIMEKTNTNNTASLVMFAIKHNIVKI